MSNNLSDIPKFFMAFIASIFLLAQYCANNNNSYDYQYEEEHSVNYPSSVYDRSNPLFKDSPSSFNGEIQRAIDELNASSNTYTNDYAPAYNGQAATNDKIQKKLNTPNEVRKLLDSPYNKLSEEDVERVLNTQSY